MIENELQVHQHTGHDLLPAALQEKREWGEKMKQKLEKTQKHQQWPKHNTYSLIVLATSSHKFCTANSIPQNQQRG